MGLSNKLSCEAGSFSCCHLNPGVLGLSGSPTVPRGLSVCECGTAQSISLHLTWSASLCWPLPCCKSSLPSCLSPPLLPVWMNVSSSTPWLSDFHTVQFSVSSGCFFFLNLLSFFWLCEEAQCVYLHLHLGWKSCISPSKVLVQVSLLPIFLLDYLVFLLISN